MDNQELFENELDQTEGEKRIEKFQEELLKAQNLTPELLIFLKQFTKQDLESLKDILLDLVDGAEPEHRAMYQESLDAVRKTL